MTTNHIDQLAEWWENAEEGVIERGDTVINRSDGETTVYVATVRARRQHPSARILSRAPKPKPAWHDAVAVTATATDELGDEITAVWVREGDELWRSDEGGMVLREDLRDVTPLIEAKVTDEARDRVWDELVYHGLIDPQKRRPSQGWTADVVHAALGLETE